MAFVAFFGLSGNFLNDLNRLGKKSCEFSALWQRILENFVHLIEVGRPCGAFSDLTLARSLSLHRGVAAVCTAKEAFVRIRIHDMVRPKVVGKAILPITVGRQPIGVRAGPVIGVALKTRFHFKHRRCLDF